MASKAYVTEITRFLKYKFFGDVDFTDNTYLLQITDVDVVKYLNLRAFGKENPSEGDLPTYGRANTFKERERHVGSHQKREVNVCTYSLRKSVWNAVGIMVRKGYAADAAIGKTQRVYGEQTPVVKLKCYEI